MPRPVIPDKVPNPSVNRTPGKLRLPVPSALRAPVASYLKLQGLPQKTQVP